MTVTEYIDKIDIDKKPYFNALRKIILENLPDGYEEVIQYGMLSYVVPHSIFPKGYHCDPINPLPFISLASQKKSINFYHMGLYIDSDLMDYFTNEYSKVAKHKIDNGKSCIRFKYYDEIPYALIGEIVSKIKVSEWIKIYEEKIQKWFTIINLWKSIIMKRYADKLYYLF